VPDYYGKQPGDYAFYEPLIELQKEFVQISLVTDYNYNPRVITTGDLSSYNALASVCADISESQRDPKHMILQIDVEGDNELDVTEETLTEYLDDAKKGVGAVKILITPSSEYDPPVPDEIQWEQQFWTDILPRFGGIDLACEMTKMEELDYTGLITELALLDKERAVYNKMMADAVEADIEVLNWELKQKKDLLEGLKEDLEEAIEKGDELRAKQDAVESLSETMQERLDFYDNQVESWEGRLRGSFDGGRESGERGSINARGSVASVGSVAAEMMGRASVAGRGPRGDKAGARGEGSGTCLIS